MKKTIFVSIFLVLILIVSCESAERPETEVIEVPDGEKPGQEIEDEVGFGDITKQQCIDAGGSWNECGSPCAGTATDFCIQVCQVQCECDNKQYACPEGFKCRLSGKVVDEIGVCIKE